MKILLIPTDDDTISTYGASFCVEYQHTQSVTVLNEHKKSSLFLAVIFKPASCSRPPQVFTIDRVLEFCHSLAPLIQEKLSFQILL